MLISTKGRYALRVMVDITLNGGGMPVSLRDVAERQEISVKYLEAIISTLVKAELVESFRGKAGGYKLAREADDITVKDIIEATEGTTVPVECAGGACPRQSGCVTAPLWSELDRVVDDFLNGVTLKDVINGNINRNI